MEQIAWFNLVMSLESSFQASIKQPICYPGDPAFFTSKKRSSSLPPHRNLPLPVLANSPRKAPRRAWQRHAGRPAEKLCFWEMAMTNGFWEDAFPVCCHVCRSLVVKSSAFSSLHFISIDFILYWLCLWRSMSLSWSRSSCFFRSLCGEVQIVLSSGFADFVSRLLHWLEVRKKVLWKTSFTKMPS